MEILCVVNITDTNVEAYTTTYKSFIDTLTNITLTTKLYLVIDNEDSIFTVNLSKMLNNTNINKCTNWSNVLSNITVTMLSTYGVTLNVRPRVKTLYEDSTIGFETYPIDNNLNQLKIHSCLTHPGLTVSYGTVEMPGLRNMSSLKWKLKDLILTKTGTNPVVEALNFNNCLPVVNGIIHKPVVFNNELYIQNVTDNLKSCYDSNKEILLLDTTRLGNMEIIRFTDCNLISESDKINRLRFTLPTNKTMKNKTPLLVVNGKLYFKGDFYKPNDKTLVVDPQLMNLRQSALVNKQLKEDFTIGTTAVTNTNTITERKSYFTNSNSVDTFIVLINTPSVRITTTYPLFNINKNSIRFTEETSGLLMLESTRDILDYTTISYESSDVVTITPRKDLYQLNESIVNTKDVCFSNTNTQPLELENIGNQRVKMVRLSLP